MSIGDVPMPGYFATGHPLCADNGQADGHAPMPLVAHMVGIASAKVHRWPAPSLIYYLCQFVINHTSKGFLSMKIAWSMLNTIPSRAWFQASLAEEHHGHAQLKRSNLRAAAGAPKPCRTTKPKLKINCLQSFLGIAETVCSGWNWITSGTSTENNHQANVRINPSEKWLWMEKTWFVQPCHASFDAMKKS